MASRAAVYGLLKTDPVLEDLGFGAVYAAESVDTPAESRFIIIRWGEKSQAFASFGPQRLTIWLHDKDQDFSQIDSGIERVKTLLGSAVHLAGPDGWTLTQADWRGDSSDLSDDGYGTRTRNTGFDVVSRYDRPNYEGA